MLLSMEQGFSIYESFNIRDFREKSILQYDYPSHYHSETSLRTYCNQLYIHKLLGKNYENVSSIEFKKLIELMDASYLFLKETKVDLSKPLYADYNREMHCIERVERYLGSPLGSFFATLPLCEKYEIASNILGQVISVMEANPGTSLELQYSMDAKLDNFVSGDKGIFYVDLMPPLVPAEAIDPLWLSARKEERIPSILPIQRFRFFNQKGVYLYFLTKTGASDPGFFRRLYDLFLEKIPNNEVIQYIKNEDLLALEKLFSQQKSYSELESKIRERIQHYVPIDRDLLRLFVLYFVYDVEIIFRNACSQKVPNVLAFLRGKTTLSDLIKGIFKGRLEKPKWHHQFKDLVIRLLALQYGTR